MVVTYLCKYNNLMAEYLTVNVFMLLFQSSMTQGWHVTVYGKYMQSPSMNFIITLPVNYVVMAIYRLS